MTYLNRRGIKLNSLDDLIKLLYIHTERLVHVPIQLIPSCCHYKDISEMKGNFCTICGHKNEVKKRGGDCMMSIYTLRDIVSDKNGFTQMYHEEHHNLRCKELGTEYFPSFVKHIHSEVNNKLKENQYMLYLGDYEYLLASPFSVGDNCLWVNSGGHRSTPCDRCYKITKGITTDFYIVLTFHSWLSQDFFAFLSKKGIDFVRDEGFDVEYFKRAQILSEFSKRGIETHNIKEYSHTHCFY